MFHLACDDPVMLFWHKGNVALIQESIVRCIYRTSEQKICIDRPSKESLLPIMFSVFDRYHASLGVKDMNLITIDEACKDVRSGLTMHLAYTQDSTSRMKPLAYPM